MRRRKNERKTNIDRIKLFGCCCQLWCDFNLLTFLPFELLSTVEDAKQIQKALIIIKRLRSYGNKKFIVGWHSVSGKLLRDSMKCLGLRVRLIRTDYRYSSCWVLVVQMICVWQGIGGISSLCRSRDLDAGYLERFWICSILWWTPPFLLMVFLPQAFQ